MLSQKTVILFNGPPRSGKDIGAQYLEANYGAVHFQLKYQLYIDTARIFSLPLETILFYCQDDELKDKPSSLFGWRSPRQALIYVSEDIVRPKMGSDHYGKVLGEKIRNSGSALNCMSDGGFIDEVLAVMQRASISQERLMVIHLHRNGCSFENTDPTKKDSRSYIVTDNVQIVENNGSPKEYYASLDAMMAELGWPKLTQVIQPANQYI